ncbi:hypothetical protein [Pantoea sp. QMID1]|nr:hypothetical protein [Pantoea sp. QMID1]GME41353.1 hypothetical protein ACJ1_27480 [Pantoea sp. QMID1]GME42835.1 hypothetical protein ACJ3_31270 [Pantoea sp. QMID3]GME56768.1 hypothetical protein ACJ4_23980 [Pantoea sp. QMID4]GME59082.1 hypothetical protein ACJ2_27680 [Pantoea sp. QMID2]
MPGEILIGEAALALLDEKKSVSWTGILVKLEARLANEQDESRADILIAAIQDVRAEMKRRSSDADKNDEGQVVTQHEDHDRMTRH